LTPDRVRSTVFSRAALSRRGYSEEEVRGFLGRIAEEIAAADAEKARLREEINRLKIAMREWQSKQADQRTRSLPSVEAVNVLSAAQQQADAYVAQAQEYCRQLTEHTRQQADAIMLEAQKRASVAAEQAAYSYRRQAGAHYTAEIEELERRATWLRTFVQAVQVQMRAASEAFSREVEKLAEPSLPESPSQPLPQQRTQPHSEQPHGFPDRPGR
jgi:DivIVA domain-containing protein